MRLHPRTSTLLAVVLKAAIILAPALSAPAIAQPSTGHAFAAVGDHFELDGKPFRIISGEMHYARVPRAYWKQRLELAKAMGLNSITTYVFWNVHETRPGVYDFSGNNDLAEFIRLAQQEGLYVILRPGPYACAEWEFGGYPAWLLKDHDVVVRSREPKYSAAVDRWIKRLGQEVASLQIGNGGPIIAVQVENEYGSFGDDHIYMDHLRQLLLDSGFTKAMLDTADGAEVLAKGTLPGIPSAINFGPGEAEKSFALLAKFRPDGPKMNGEYWDGWFDHWGDKHQVTDTRQQTAELDWILSHGYSISIYMLEGGTSFGWMNGANSDGKNYQPDVTSYDYDAALSESGVPTPKYYAFRDVITKATGITPPPVPANIATMTIPSIALNESVPLWKTLPAPTHSEQPLSMEDLDQAYGYILYRTALHGPVNGDLVLDQLHDYAQVYLDGKLIGKLDRRLSQSKLALNVTAASTQLDILVENSGRVNYTAVIRGERKGITHQITLAGKPVTGWDIYTLPMLNPGTLTYKDAPCEGACFYRASFTIGQPADTFLKTAGLGKGQVWINGHALGRFWDIGPQETLYLPGSWLHAGKNDVVIFDLKAQPGRTVEGLDKPVLDGPVRPE